MWGTEAGWLLLAAATAGVAHGTTTSPPGTSALAPPDDFIDIVWAPDAVRTHLSRELSVKLRVATVAGLG